MAGLTQVLASELSASGIRVQALSPGQVDTPLVSETQPARRSGGGVGARRFGEAVVQLVGSPTDTVVVHPHLLRVPQRSQASPVDGQLDGSS